MGSLPRHPFIVACGDVMITPARDVILTRATGHRRSWPRRWGTPGPRGATEGTSSSSANIKCVITYATIHPIPIPLESVLGLVCFGGGLVDCWAGLVDNWAGLVYCWAGLVYFWAGLVYFGAGMVDFRAGLVDC